MGILMSDKRNFALRDEEGKEVGIFSGRSPRQAALKAATRGVTEIRLREKGTKKIHVFRGERVSVKKPKGSPAWLPKKIWRSNVKKLGVENLPEE